MGRLTEILHYLNSDDPDASRYTAFTPDEEAREARRQYRSERDDPQLGLFE